jgi:hypothetical protein
MTLAAIQSSRPFLFYRDEKSAAGAERTASHVLRQSQVQQLANCQAVPLREAIRPQAEEERGPPLDADTGVLPKLEVRRSDALVYQRK